MPKSFRVPMTASFTVCFDVTVEADTAEEATDNALHRPDLTQDAFDALERYEKDAALEPEDFTADVENTVEIDPDEEDE